MSTTITALCWPLQMPPTAKAVLISLADNANDQGYCWPSIPTIAIRTCFSERAIQGAIKWLEQHGAIRADRSNGRHTTYYITASNYIQPPQEMHRLTVEESLDTPAGDAPPHEMPPAGDAPTPAGDAPLPPQEVRQPPQEMPSNRKEPSLEPSGNRHKRGQAVPIDDDPLPVLLEAGVDGQTAKDWLRHRKTRKASTSLTVIRSRAKEAAKADITLDDALAMEVSRGWNGFEAGWVKPEAKARASPGYQTPNEKQKSFADRLTGNRNAQRDAPDIIDIN